MDEKNINLGDPLRIQTKTKENFDNQMVIMKAKLKVLRTAKILVTISLIIFVGGFIMPENAISKWYIPISCFLCGTSLLFSKIFWDYYGKGITKQRG